MVSQFSVDDPPKIAGRYTEDDKFTGKWECMTVPSGNIPVDATICGGVPTAAAYADKVILGYMTDKYYEKAQLQ